MIHKISTGETFEYFRDEFKLICHKRSCIRTKPPKNIDPFSGMFGMSETGAFFFLNDTRHPTLAQNGCQPVNHVWSQFNGVIK